MSHTADSFSSSDTSSARKRELIAEMRGAILGVTSQRAACIKPARSVACPACGSPAGRPCIVRSRAGDHRLSGRYSQAHPARETAVGFRSQDGWLLPPG